MTNSPREKLRNSIIDKISVKPGAFFFMHAAISYYFAQMVDLNRVETCMHNSLNL